MRCAASIRSSFLFVCVCVSFLMDAKHCSSIREGEKKEHLIQLFDELSVKE